MRALLLSAGFGTRLKPLTDTLPKCLVPIKQKPLLEIWLDQLSEAGIKEFLVNTHYLNNQVEDFVAASKYKNRITLVYEPRLLGTAGTLIANINFFQDSDGMLIHADNYCLSNLKLFQEAHWKRPKECLMTMMTFRTEEPSACGIVEINNKGIVIGFHEKVSNPPGNLANSAIYIISKELLKELSVGTNKYTDFSLHVLPNFLKKIYTYETKEQIIDIGKMASYKKANLI